MREIKFRAWSETLKEMENNVFPAGKGRIATWMSHGLAEKNLIVHGVSDYVLMQFINRRDKEGKEVFKDDILLDISIFVVVWNNEQASFMLQRDDGELFPIDEYSFVNKIIIGNIHQNPELLRKEKK